MCVGFGWCTATSKGGRTSGTLVKIDAQHQSVNVVVKGDEKRDCSDRDGIVYTTRWRSLL